MMSRKHYIEFADMISDLIDNNNNDLNTIVNTVPVNNKTVQAASFYKFRIILFFLLNQYVGKLFMSGVVGVP